MAFKIDTGTPIGSGTFLDPFKPEFTGDDSTIKDWALADNNTSVVIIKDSDKAKLRSNNKWKNKIKEDT